jgi:hypothetical protein
MGARSAGGAGKGGERAFSRPLRFSCFFLWNYLESYGILLADKK